MKQCLITVAIHVVLGFLCINITSGPLHAIEEKDTAVH